MLFEIISFTLVLAPRLLDQEPPPLLLFQLLLLVVDEVGELAYTYSPSTYVAADAKVFRLSRFVYRCSRRYISYFARRVSTRPIFEEHRMRY